MLYIYIPHYLHHAGTHVIQNLIQCYFVHLSGLLNTDKSVTKSFFLNETILLQINKLSSASQYSLSWYHNGTQVIFNERMTVSGNGTSLLIVNMTESDAGKYEVKLSSINSCGCSSSPTCDRNIMNMFEFSAMFSTVTFYLQQHQIPQYKPENVIKVYFLRVKHPTINTTYSITTNYTHSINTSYIIGRNSVFYQHMLRVPRHRPRERPRERPRKIN